MTGRHQPEELGWALRLSASGEYPRTAMRWRRLHAWEVGSEEAERIQSSLASRALSAAGPLSPEAPALIAGAAVSAQFAAIAVLAAETWELVETSRVGLPAQSPGGPHYRSGLMAFTLGPALLQAFERIRSRADVAIFRAHGIAHPRRCGMAAHLGLLLEVPSVGCADTLLCGEYGRPGPQRGDWTPVTAGGDIVGGAVRTRQGSRPVFVSPGYGMGIQEAVGMALRCTVRSRLPEPLRVARLVARGA